MIREGSLLISIIPTQTWPDITGKENHVSSFVNIGVKILGNISKSNLDMCKTVTLVGFILAV
jgi:hypothetical protein